MENYQIITTNQRLGPYVLGTTDQVQIRTSIYYNSHISYLSGIPIVLYLNLTGVFAPAISGLSDRYGNLTLYNSCENINNINCCLGYTRATINNKTYDSNRVRFNFIKS